MIDSTYLRTIHDGLLSGTIHKDNASTLPIGLIGIYEEALPPSSNVNERIKFLEFFGVLALLKNEVSADFLVSLLVGWSKQEILNFIDLNSKWFISSESGKFQIYHELLRIYVLQKLSGKQLVYLNNLISVHLSSELNADKATEVHLYGLRYLSHHLMLHYLLSKDIEPLMKLMKDEAYRGKQIYMSKSEIWTLNTLRDGINASLIAEHDQDAIENVIKYLSIELNLTNNLDRLIENLQSGELEISLNTLSYIQSHKSDRVELMLTYILCMAILETDESKRINMLRCVDSFIENLDKEIELITLPCLIKFELADFSFRNNIGFDYLYQNSKVKLDNDLTLEKNPINLNIEKYKEFIIHLFSHKKEKLSKGFCDSVIYAALKAGESSIVQIIVESGFNDFSSKTAELLAYQYFLDNRYQEFLEVLLKKEEFVFMWKSLTKRIYLGYKYDKTIEFINQVPDRFVRSILMAQLAEVLLVFEDFEKAQFLIETIKPDFLTNEVDDSEINSVISMLELKLSVLLNPQTAIDYSASDELTINNVINALSLLPGSKHLALTLYRMAGYDLFSLNLESINTISFLLGCEGAVDEFISEYRKELRKKENTLFSGYNWEEDWVVHFILGLPLEPKDGFYAKFSSIIEFICSSENLGASYFSITQARQLYYIYDRLIEFKEHSKAKYVYDHIHSTFIKRKIDNISKVEICSYLELRYKVGGLAITLEKRIKKHLSSSTIDWDQDYHLARVSEEILGRGEDSRALSLFIESNPLRWQISKFEASIKWKKISSRFLKVYLKKGLVANTVELYEHCIKFLNSNAALEMLHQIAMASIIQDSNIKDLIIKETNKIIHDLDSPYSDRITREVRNRIFYSSLILLAEIYMQLGQYENGRQIYYRICEELDSFANYDDLQLILQKLCRSLVQFKYAEFYPFIIEKLFVVDTLLLGVIEWKETLHSFRKELLRLKDDEKASIINSKIAILDRIEIEDEDNRINNDSNADSTVYYLSPFHSYRNSLFNTSGNHMLNVMIRFAAYNCFSGYGNEAFLKIMSRPMDLNNWRILGILTNSDD